MTPVVTKSLHTIPRRFDNHVAIVTASTAGIGLAIAKRIAEEGCTVVISSRKSENVESAVKQLRDQAKLKVDGHVCHVGREADRQSLIGYVKEKYGKLDILVSNAAVNPVLGPLLTTPESAWDKIFEVNVKAAFLLTKEAVPLLEKSRGNILFVSSIAGFDPLPGLGAYSVSKTALFGLTKTLAKELGEKGIRVNCLAPGVIETDFSRVLYQDDRAKEKILGMVPLKQLGKPEQMAGVAAFLCSKDAEYVTGEIIAATGGMTSRL